MNVLNRQHVNPFLVRRHKGFVGRTASEEGTGVAADAEHPDGSVDARKAQGGDVDEGGGGGVVWLELRLGLGWEAGARVDIGIGEIAGEGE